MAAHLCLAGKSIYTHASGRNRKVGHQNLTITAAGRLSRLNRQPLSAANLMKLNTHLILVSAQPIPNITPMLDDAVKPKKVVMLVSPDMQERARTLENIFKPRGIGIESYAIADPWNAELISDKVLDILCHYPDGGIALNATGGTKLMSIAACEAFRSANAPIYYVHPRYDRLLWLSPKLPPHELADRLKLKDYLMAYGADLVDIPAGVQSVPPAIQELTGELLAGIDRYADELGTLNYLAYQSDNAQLSAKIGHSRQSRPVLWELLELFEAAGICCLEHRLIRFSDPQMRFIANGGWLEMHTYAACLQLKQKCGIQDVACNIVIQRHPAGKTAVKNEIDVGLIHANRLHLIECKTRHFEKDADMLYKLDSLRDLMGGLQGRTMLVSFNNLGKASRARARELNVSLCCKTELKHLQQHLTNWLTTRG
ncbi:Card1-like endonuclease domain-containing protein [Nitrosomonas ureae]|nr:DUF1887 family CARF protein [Nitrosomonas ureae]